MPKHPSIKNKIYKGQPPILYDKFITKKADPVQILNSAGVQETLDVGQLARVLRKFRGFSNPGHRYGMCKSDSEVVQAVTFQLEKVDQLQKMAQLSCGCSCHSIGKVNGDNIRCVLLFSLVYRDLTICQSNEEDMPVETSTERHLEAAQTLIEFYNPNIGKGTCLKLFKLVLCH